MSEKISYQDWFNPLQTPHSGYHWDAKSRNFFEGWYFRVTLPQQQQSFAFMYSIEDPLGNGDRSGGAAQVLGIEDQYLCRTFPNVNNFWASSDYLALVHWGKTSLSLSPQLLTTSLFQRHISQGYQVTANLHQGSLQIPHLKQSCRWFYRTRSLYGWGNPHKKQQATAGLLSALPLFEPGWQILMAQGWATGWIEWNGTKFEFQNAPAYSEKNWGFSFPERWFWMQCNSFKHEQFLTVTAGGGKRKVLGITEEVGMIGIHYQGDFYEFAPWNSQISWNISAWGDWQLEAKNDFFQVSLAGQTTLQGTPLRAPTLSGFQICCRETLRGQLTLILRDRRGRKIVQDSSNLAGLEVGGKSWSDSINN